MSKKTKKVLLIATVQSHIGQFHKPLMQLLKENGWEIHVAARNNLDEKDGLQLEYPDQVFDVPFQRSPTDRRNIEAYQQLKKILNANHYDVIHCNTPVGGMLGRLAARKYRKKGTKVFYTAHGFHFYKGSPKLNWLIYYPIEKWMSRFTDKLITITEEDYILAKRKFHCNVYHIHGVGVDEERFYPVSDEEKKRMKKAAGYDNPLILSIGELVQNKNQRMAIDIMCQVRYSCPAAQLLIAGNGPEELKLKDYAKSKGLDQSVQFIGYRRDIEKFQKIADLLIACSFREGLPLNIVEAMLSETVVIATDNRGHRELIENGSTGYIVDTCNREKTAQLVTDLLNDDMKTEIIKKKAIYKAHSYCSSEVKKELGKIYDI